MGCVDDATAGICTVKFSPEMEQRMVEVLGLLAAKLKLHVQIDLRTLEEMDLRQRTLKRFEEEIGKALLKDTPVEKGA